MKKILTLATALLLAGTSSVLQASHTNSATKSDPTPRPNPSASPHFNGPVFSPDGQKVYYHQIGVGIWSMDADGRHKKPIIIENMNDRWVRFSANGKKISFVSPMRGFPWSGYTANADGSNVQLLESADTDNWQMGLAWLDDERLVYGEMVPFQKDKTIQTLYLTDANAANPKAIAKGVWPAMSSDRSKIIYGGEKTAEDGTKNFDVLVYDLASSTEMQVTTNKENDYGATFSHDGSEIYFIRAEDEGNWLMVMKADGSDQRSLGIAVQADSRPAASPDGKYLLFAKPNFVTQHLDIFRLDLTTGDQSNLTANHP